MPVTLNTLLKMKLQARASILDGLLHDRCVIMAFAWRGVGKTWFALGLAYAIATGGTFLKWKAPQARRVLYIDVCHSAWRSQYRAGSPRSNPWQRRRVRPD